MKKVRFSFAESDEAIQATRPSTPAWQRKGILKKQPPSSTSLSEALRRTKSSPIQALRSSIHHAPSGSMPTQLLPSSHEGPHSLIDSIKRTTMARRSFTVGHKQESSSSGRGSSIQSWADGPALTGRFSPYYNERRPMMREPASPFFLPSALTPSTQRRILTNHLTVAFAVVLSVALFGAVAVYILRQSNQQWAVVALALVALVETIHLSIWSRQKTCINASSQLQDHRPPIRSHRRPSSSVKKNRIRSSVAGNKGVDISASRHIVTLQATKRKQMAHRGARSGAIIPLPSVSSSWAAWRRMQCRDVTDGLDIQTYISAWFRGALFEEVKSGNVKEFIAYAFFYRSLAEIDRLGIRRLIYSMVDDLETTFDISFPRGYNPAVQFMGHLREDLNMSWRPLSLFYLPAFGLTQMGRVMLSSLGFHHLHLHSVEPSASPPWGKRVTCSSGVESWRIHYLPGDMDLTPIVFLHGIGIGHAMYGHFLSSLKATRASIISIEHPHVSLNICQAVPTSEEIVDRVVSSLSALGMVKVLLVAHSYGCLIASRLLQRRPDLIAGLVMADPVCLGMFMPHLVRSAIYRIPQTLKDLLIWTVVREPSAATFFCRQFYWSTLNLNVEDLPPGRTVLVLHGKDRLVDVPAILRWIQSLADPSSIRVVYQPDGTHGALLLKQSWMADSVSAIAMLLDEIKGKKD